ncbi:MAG: metallophosphoesterase, partial [Nitrososphaeraceae archaeon]|nr:metallophosphoesterase [Nitrososphaeraceae archaeon]
YSYDSYHYNNKNDDDTDGIFNIAVAGDWGCKDDTNKTVENIQNKDPELVLAAGDLSYKGSSQCWFEIIEPIQSKMKIAMGDHEYSDTNGGQYGLINQYLKPFNLEKTYYSFDKNNVHVTIMDPYIDYKPGSAQYEFIEQDLKNTASNPYIDWTFVVESIPIYTAPSKHPGDSDIKDIYHPLFDKYGVDLVFSSDNHNYQRTYPLKYNNNNNGGDDGSQDPIITYVNDNNSYNSDNGGVVYLIIGTGGRSLYDVKGDAPFLANSYDKQFGFLNIDVYSSDALVGTFYANEDYSYQDDDNENGYYFINTASTAASAAAFATNQSPYDNNIRDQFIISSNTKYQESNSYY